jgi:hypothetical protein
MCGIQNFALEPSNRWFEPVELFAATELQAGMLRLRYFGCKCGANYLRSPYC